MQYMLTYSKRGQEVYFIFSRGVFRAKPNKVTTNRDANSISVLETLEKPSNNTYNGIKWFTSKPANL